ncbi:hypothetical protein TSAR_014602 [Trichomalopsis sarcophagae]|uniref:Uncharacterized protein n=1 Tax=Trichomalopsis sarcophagae TaxID=543379 RepID=A0A232F2Q6_9HYME|nr:hypothetical protein TSAR_014602 [Trichomalopsis sarcophagae]
MLLFHRVYFLRNYRELAKFLFTTARHNIAKVNFSLYSDIYILNTNSKALNRTVIIHIFGKYGGGKSSRYTYIYIYIFMYIKAASVFRSCLPP